METPDASHSLRIQQQALQRQATELDLSLKELADADTAYRIVGGLLIRADVATLRADLERRRETVSERVKLLEKQLGQHGRDH